MSSGAIPELPPAVEQAEISAFADHHRHRKRKDPGMRDIDDRQDAHRRRLDHMSAKAMEISRPRTAGIDKGGGAAGLGHRRGVDTERGAAPINMCVQVDEAGHDKLAGGIDDFRAGARQVAADLGDLAVREGDVGDLVAPVRRIDDAPAGEDQSSHRTYPVTTARMFTSVRGAASRRTRNP
jgi:hypothetical protein